jgi:hypothetical protein
MWLVKACVPGRGPSLLGLRTYVHASVSKACLHLCKLYSMALCSLEVLEAHIAGPTLNAFYFSVSVSHPPADSLGGKMGYILGGERLYTHKAMQIQISPMQASRAGPRHWQGAGTLGELTPEGTHWLQPGRFMQCRTSNIQGVYCHLPNSAD